ncbi:hypothetical protein Gotri_011334, partial [Gossypium trilobum]|nr:hypothetical protein [Gossypium trilobum]
SIKAAVRLNILKVVFESGCAILVNRINRKGQDITIIGQCMDKARMKLGSFSSVDVNANGQSDNFSANQARAHRNVANDSRTKFPRSIKYLLGFLMHCFGLELGLPIPPVILGLVLAQPSLNRILPIVVLVPSGYGVPSFIVLFTPLPIHLLGGLLADVRGCYYYRWNYGCVVVLSTCVVASSMHWCSIVLSDAKNIFERPCNADVAEECYLVDPASSHMFVSKIKPYMCKYEQIQTVKLRMAY